MTRGFGLALMNSMLSSIFLTCEKKKKKKNQFRESLTVHAISNKMHMAEASFSHSDDWKQRAKYFFIHDLSIQRGIQQYCWLDESTANSKFFIPSLQHLKWCKEGREKQVGSHKSSELREPPWTIVFATDVSSRSLLSLWKCFLLTILHKESRVRSNFLIVDFSNSTYDKKGEDAST